MPRVSSPSGLAGFNFEDLTNQAQQKLNDCRAEVARMLEAAKLEAIQLRSSAHQEGLAAGRQQAANEAEQQLQASLQKRMGEHSTAVKSMVQQIADQHQAWMKQYSDSLVAIAIDVAESVIREKLKHEPEILVRWAEDAVTTSRSANRLTVAVHPETLAELGEALDQLLRTPGLPDDSVLVPDESVQRTGVVVRQLGGEVDSSLATQLETLRELLRNAS